MQRARHTSKPNPRLQSTIQPEVERPNLDGIHAAAIAIAEQRRDDLLKIKQKLLQGDDAGALELMRAFCGITASKLEGGF